MTREAIIANVKKKYANADEATIDAVLRTLQETNLDWRLPELRPVPAPTVHKAAEVSKPLEFVGEHMTLEQYRQLSFSERGEHKRQLKAKNREWLEAKYASLRAAWLMVMDGEIIAYGTSLQDYPSTEKIREIGGRYGKRPFIFINDLFVAIEESKIAWHPTIYDHDFYPTVPIVLRTDSGSMEIAADFDTGAVASFVDYDLLLAHAVLKSDNDGEGESSEHLGQTFEYFGRFFMLEIKLPSGEILSQKLLLNCVTDWRFSPFVSINPHRNALAGRDLFLKLKPNILLDFVNQRTKLVTPEQAQNL
jgi:hypothetical protein